MSIYRRKHNFCLFALHRMQFRAFKCNKMDECLVKRRHQPIEVMSSRLIHVTNVETVQKYRQLLNLISQRAHDYVAYEIYS